MCNNELICGMLKKFNEVPSVKWSSLAAVVSIVIGILIRATSYKELIGYPLLSLWALCPPIWFLYDYSTSTIDKAVLKELHNLSRNIWIAFVIVLAVIIGIPWPGGK